MPITRQSVLDALRTVRDPELGKDLVTLGTVKDIKIDGATVELTLELATPGGPAREKIEREAVAALGEAGAEQVTFGHVEPPAPSANSPLPQVKNIIAVGAGKGGVGKSTVALNLAVALQRKGFAVGLMDGDVYGPSMPTMLGIKGAVPKISPTNKSKILPHRVHGIHAITIGSLVEPEKPLIWRGPMAQGAFKQLLVDNTDWPPLDYLIVDLPPGTGDVPLTLCQMLPLSGAVVVATPQQVALDDATRAVRMFQQLGVPVLGLVENMSYFVGPDGNEHDIFGRGGTERAAKKLQLPLLGAIPMFTELRVNSDAGRPHANFEGPAKLAAALTELAAAVAGEVSRRNLMGMPTLSVS